MRHALLSLVLLVLACARLAAAEPALDLVLLGDWGARLSDKGSTPEHPSHKNFDRQRIVALELASRIRHGGEKPDAVILLGDNFYGPLDGPDDPRWRKTFSEMYPRDVFPMPFYFVLGNHDYEDHQHRNWRLEMEWTGDDRWRAPSARPGATWMRVDLPREAPLVSLYLLNNVIDGVNGLGRKAGYLGWSAQREWLDAELAKPQAPWIAAATHYPPYSNGAHHKDDGPKPAVGPWINDRPSWLATRRDLVPPLLKAGAQLWFAGHDHNLQHLTHESCPGLDILVSGGGGGDHPYGRHPLAPKEPLLIKAPGWVDVHLTRDRATVTYWYVGGKGLERGPIFERVRDGTTAPSDSAPREK